MFRRVQVKRAFIDIFTDGTNKDVDYAKVMGAIGLAAFLVYGFYSYAVNNQPFAPIEWATGFSVLIAAATGASKLKDWTVPTNSQKGS